MKKQFMAMAYCSPTGEYVGEYPNRLTDEVFQALKDAGITHIIARGWDQRAETIKKAKELCAKYEIGYLAHLHTSEDYVRVCAKGDKKPWSERTTEEKEALDAQFVAEMQEMLAYNPNSVVKGVFFDDENGYLTFEAEVHAKEVFEKHFKGYEFHSNFVSYSMNDNLFWGGYLADNPKLADVKKPFPLDGKLKITFENRFHYYDKFVEGLLSKTQMDVISWDAYSFCDIWKELPTCLHRNLFDLTAFFAHKAKEHGSQFINYMQVGNWENHSFRKLTFGEMALQMNVTMAYGGSGFGWFPAVFPIDFADLDKRLTHGGCGFVDLAGKPTKYVDMAKQINQFYQPFLNDLLDSECLGVTAYGEYDNGFDKETAAKLPDSEAIFMGELPPMEQYRDERIAADCSNEIMVGTFEREGKRRYFVVNLSSVYGNEIHLRLPEGKYVVYEMENQTETDENVSLVLAMGCAAYIQEK